MACFTDVNVSQGSAATHARCGGIFNTHLTANLPRNLQVTIFLNRLTLDRIMVVSPQPAFFAHPVNVKCENKYLLRTLSQAKKVDLLLSTLYIYTHNRLMAICPGLPGRAGSRRNIHPLTAMRRKKKKDSHRQQGLL